MSKSSNQSIGVFGLLGVAFVILKLIGILDWSWWWVTLPFWGGFGFIILMAALIGIILGIYKAIKKRKI